MAEAASSSKRQKTKGGSAAGAGALSSTVGSSDAARNCDLCRGSLVIAGVGDCPMCVYTDEVVAVDDFSGPARNADATQKVRDCDLCSGSRHIRGLGDCPKCMPEVQLLRVTPSVQVVDESIDVDKGKECDICSGSRQVQGLGPCPVCNRARCPSGSNLQLKADQAVAQLLVAKEHLQSKADQAVKADRTVAELLKVKDDNEEEIRTLLLKQEEAELREQEAKKLSARNGSEYWHRLATIDEDVSDEEKLRAFFERRQQGNAALQIQQCIKVQNQRLIAFNPKAGNRPTLIFHGTPERNVGNIMTEGLLMEFCKGCGGIFGAMNPQTSLGYARKAGDQRSFMALCVYDLPLGGAEPQPGGAYNVPTDDAATVLWLLKVA